MIIYDSKGKPTTEDEIYNDAVQIAAETVSSVRDAMLRTWIIPTPIICDPPEIGELLNNAAAILEQLRRIEERLAALEAKEGNK